MTPAAGRDVAMFPRGPAGERREAYDPIATPRKVALAEVPADEWVMTADGTEPSSESSVTEKMPANAARSLERGGRCTATRAGGREVRRA